MNNNPTATNTPSEPLLCKMGCGFFGSNATGDCCSKCWNDSQKKKNSVSTAASSVTHTQEESQQIDNHPTHSSSDCHDSTSKQDVEASSLDPVMKETLSVEVQPPIMKKKKKKTSYKDMMASYTSKRKSDADMEKEKEKSIQKVTGGGAFFTSLQIIHANHNPIALHQLIQVEEGDELVIHLSGFDADEEEMIATITSLPESGTLHQLTQVFDLHGYDPKAGTQITSVPFQISSPYGSLSRVVYKRPKYDHELYGEWGRFNYIMTDIHGNTSHEATIVLIPPSRIILGSDFLFSDEGWSTSGNRPDGVTHDRTTLGVMSYFIYSSDNSLNIQEKGYDRDLWHFEAPEKFHGWQAIMYGATMKFDMSSFGGDYSLSKRNFEGKLNIVEIACSHCNMNKGITLGYPLSSTSGFDGQTKPFALPLVENGGWVKDPQNSNLEWTVPTRCEMYEVLSGITSIRILGDFTNWYESISIDNFQIVANKVRGQYQMPLCAQQTRDNRKCTC